VGLLGENMTVGDRLRNIWKNYIAPTEEEIKVGKKEEELVAGDGLFPEQKHDPFTKKLSVEKCIDVAGQCPLFMKGARKKARDSIRAWHRIEHLDKTKKPFSLDLFYINQFSQRNNLKKLWETFRVASYVTGDGYLLITFDKDEKTNLEDPPAEGACPYKVRLLNSKFIPEIGYYPERKEFWEARKVKHFHYVDDKNNEDLWIHPDRIIHMENDKLFGEFGNSKVNLLRNIIKSSVNIDIATGDILAWFAHGLLDIMQEGCGDNERKRWENIVKLHPGAYIHDETAKLTALAPQAIDPKPFYDYLVLSIAAAFYMPTHILTGIQVGKVTGAEIGTGDYVKDLKDDQELDHNPLLNRLYEMILKAKNRKWNNYEIVWNPIYIDELSEAEILEKKVSAAEKALNGVRGAGGFIDIEEARRIFNLGQISLDASKKIKVREPQIQKPETPEKPDDEDEDEESIVKPTEKAKDAAKKYGIELDPYTFQLDAATKGMIEKRKAQAKKEHELGEKILEEQDKDDSDKD